MAEKEKLTRRLDTFHDSQKCRGRVQIVFVYLAEGFEFWVEGVCMKCGAFVRSITPLEQLISMTPNPANRPFFKPPLERQQNLSKEDKDFLKDLGINNDE